MEALAKSGGKWPTQTLSWKSDFLMNPDGAPSTSMVPHLVLCKGAALADVLLPIGVAGGRAPDGVPLVKVLLQHSAQAEAWVGRTEYER